MSEKSESFYREAAKSRSENLDNSRNQAFCSKLEKLLLNIDSTYAALMQIVRSDIATDWLTTLSENEDYHPCMLKQYQQTAESGNQTSLVSSTSAADKDPNKTVIDAGRGQMENTEENIEVSSRHFATHGSRKGPSIANSR